MSLSLLFNLRRTLLANRLRGLRKESRLKIAVVVFLALVFWVGFFFVFLEGFRFISTYEAITALMHDILFSLFFVSLLIMLTFSNAVICFSSFYRSSEMEHLIASPVSLSSLLFYKFTESLTFSSWAFVLLAVPFLLAYGVNAGAHPAFYAAIFLFFIPFIVIPGALGTLLGVLLTACFPRNRGKVLGAAAVGVILFVVVFSLNLTHWRPLEENIFAAGWMHSVVGKLAFAQNPYLPSQWMSRGLIVCASGMISDAVFYLLLLYANALFLYALLDGACSFWFLTSWRNAQEAGSRTRRRQGPGSFRLGRDPNDMILLKDLKIFVRDPVQWSQCAILFGILAIYILNLRNFQYHIAEAYWKNIVAFLNLTATCLTLATLTTRFVFPMISLEGRRFWILGHMPVSRWSILRTKFIFVSAGTFLITILLVGLSNFMLGTIHSVRILQYFTALMVCVGLSGLAVGMGVIFPNFNETDPSKIVSGFGGTFTLVLSMFYVGAVIVLELVPCHYYLVKGAMTGGEFRLAITLSLSAAVLLTAAVCIIPLWVGRRAFDRLEL